MKKMRKDSFLGMHFDFHANKKDIIGNPNLENIIQEVIDTIHPDYLQCDSKGGPGLTSYPTKLENAAPGIKQDILKVWREVTERNDVALYAHYASMDDMNAVEVHPEWALIKPDGTPDNRLFKVPGEYLDKRIIPQLCEIAGDYGLDGAWLDGAGFSIKPNYHPDVIKQFTEETGITEIPKTKDDPYYFEWLEFTRKEYRKARKYYLDAIHEKYPNFQICCNWDYTSYDPTAVDSGIDFISADIWGIDTFNILRLENRFVSQHKKPWDMMIWDNAQRFEGGSVSSRKSLVQLEQEYASVMAQGGGVELYMGQNRDGSVDLEKLPLFKEIGAFCRKFENALFKSTSLSQVAILFDGNAARRRYIDPFAAFDTPFLNGIKGILNAFADSQISVDIIGEWQLDNLSEQYKLIVVPEWETVSNKDSLVRFAKNGGTVLVVGSKCVKLFENELGVTFTDTLKDLRVYLGNKTAFSSFGTLSDVVLFNTTSAKPIEYLYSLRSQDNPNIIPNRPIEALTVNQVGMGQFAGIYFDMGYQYTSGKTFGTCDFIKRTVKSLIGELDVIVEGSRYVEVAHRTKDNKQVVSLINIATPHSDLQAFTFDEILPIPKITVKIKCDKKPASITLVPQNKAIDFTYEDGYAKVEVENIEILTVLVVE